MEIACNGDLSMCSTMEEPGVVNFKVGQLVELKSFAKGYRGAWFRCEIKDIILKMNKIMLEYPDFEEEEISCEKIYEAPPYGRKSMHTKKQLMLRPSYPPTYHKSKMPPANSISEVCVVIDGTWKVGDMVDWYSGSVFWSARVIKVLSDDKVQIEFPMPPAGEGKEDETHEAFCKDLRPYLEWSQSKGWTLPTVEGQTSCDAHLIFPSEQGIDQDLNPAGSTPNASSDSIGEEEEHIKMDDVIVEGETERPSSSPVDNVVCEEEVQTEDAKVDNAVMETSANFRENRSAVVGEGGILYNIDLNIKYEDTIEAAICDMKETVNKVEWMQSLLNKNGNELTASWKFV